MLKKFCPLVLLLILCACGAGSNDSNVITPTDSISSTAVVRFNPANATVTVLEHGPDAKSDVFEACMFSMDTVTGDLPFALVDADTLKLGTGTFNYKRPLKTPKTKTGVNDRVFSVWGNPDLISEGVTLSFEVEVEPELLTFRMNCTG